MLFSSESEHAISFKLAMTLCFSFWPPGTISGGCISGQQLLLWRLGMTGLVSAIGQHVSGLGEGAGPHMGADGVLQRSVPFGDNAIIF